MIARIRESLSAGFVKLIARMMAWLIRRRSTRFLMVKPVQDMLIVVVEGEFSSVGVEYTDSGVQFWVKIEDLDNPGHFEAIPFQWIKWDGKEKLWFYLLK